ncbi:hypothetical protein QTO34_016434 [Cnephaeus nilssonii]|uniref:Mammalian defensins domain-containing protein n=1 Tax=Cnephaeus nilssonii TaxID=3371016 RepID=A0AA40LPQ1_CNENI|nr:hypothetical protein QTO34_016434 [Eptesicus nilssonii]
MRTLALLAALLLLALQAQARTLQETADQVPTQDQPEAKDQGELWSEDQDQAGNDDQDVAISITGEERLAREAPGETTANTPGDSEDLHEASYISPPCPFPMLPDPPLPTTGFWKLRRCTCRPNRFCKSFESPSGTCTINGYRYKRCCR